MKSIITTLIFLCLGINASAQTDYRAVEQALAKLIYKHPEPICGDTIATKLAQKFKKSPEMMTAIASAYMRNNNRSKAEFYLDKANAIDRKGMKGYPPALVLQGDIYRDYSDIDSAATFYERAIAIDPTDPDPYVNYALMYACYGEAEKAVQKIEEMRIAIPGYNVDPIIADIYTLAKDNESVNSFYENIDYDRLRRDQVLRYAINLYEQKKYDEGITLLSKTRNKWPKEKQINRLLLWHCAAAHQYDDAITNAKVFLDKTPEDSVWTIDYFALGSSYLLNTHPKAGDYSQSVDDAFNAFKKCEAKDDVWRAAKKNIPSVFTAATKNLREEKRYDEALALMNRYIQYRGTNATSYNYISIIQILNAQLTDIDDKTRTLHDAQPLLNACTDFIRRYKDDQNLDFVMFLKWRWLTSFDKKMDYTAVQEALDLYRVLKNTQDRDKGQDSRLIQSIHYLASYNWEKLDRRTRAREYCREILAIDPNNEFAKNMLGQ